MPLLGAVLAVAALAACGPAPPSYKLVVDVKQMMQSIVDPAADGVWKSVSMIYTTAGMEERRPRTAKEWDVVRDHAITLAESGNLLMMPGRAKDGGDWMKYRAGTGRHLDSALRAVEAKDYERLLDVGGPIDEVCERCHKKYWPNY